MSQEQLRRPQADEQSPKKEPIKFGDVFNVTGELASKPIGPQDAAAMQSAENLVLGQTRKSGPAAVMQSAATVNEREGLVSHNQADVAGDQGVSLTMSEAGGEVWVTEAVGGQVVGQYIQPEIPGATTPGLLASDPITVGEALETVAISAADKPIEQSDAAAIQAAEMRATERNATLPGGIGSEAQSAATKNTRTMRFEDQTTLSDVLSDATLMLPKDKPVTREDADKVVAAELRNNPDMATTPGGVGAAMAAAARLNQYSPT
ncbi:Seed maturation protein [Corchorus olitorius]|uniref:Seed maturation protein n=2 Tax=Corchorus olitorius TaxID=93759 RepID=A0A1R3KD75_9ROSI|nr:Seed maturation protein [Corchorus olitorius]